MKSEYLNNRTFENIICRFQQSKKDRAKHKLLIDESENTTKRKSIRGEVSIDKDKQMLNGYIEEYAVSNNQHDTSQLELASAFYTLSQNIVRYAKFNLIDADDAVQEGVMICFDKIDRFDPRKGKAFNYMTTCILNHFRQLYRTARNYNELKKKYHEFLQVKYSTTMIRNGKEVHNNSKNN